MNYQDKPVEQLFQDVKDYVIAQRNLAMTVLSKKGADTFFIIVTTIILLLIGWFFLIFLSFAAAYALGNLIGIVWVGFLIVAFLYLLLGVVIWLNKDRWIKVPLFKVFFNLLAPDKDQDYE